MVTFTRPRSQAKEMNALKDVWQTINIDSCPYEYNFHLHTICSDGKMNPIALIKQAIALGLKGLAITDHHSTQGWEIAQRHLNHLEQIEPNLVLPHLWRGIEITSNLLDTEVHILGYEFDPNHEAMKPYVTGTRPKGKDSFARVVIQAIHSAGGLAVLAHPFRYRLRAEDLVPASAELGIDGIEAYYGYSHPKPWLPSLKQTEKAIVLAKQYNLATTCGTDSHGLTILETI